MEIPDNDENFLEKQVRTNTRGSASSLFGSNGPLNALTAASRNWRPNQLLRIFEAISQNGLSGTGLYQHVREGKLTRLTDRLPCRAHYFVQSIISG